MRARSVSVQSTTFRIKLMKLIVKIVLRCPIGPRAIICLIKSHKQVEICFNLCVR